jgi:hypothetical protein
VRGEEHALDPMRNTTAEKQSAAALERHRGAGNFKQAKGITIKPLL